MRLFQKEWNASLIREVSIRGSQSEHLELHAMLGQTPRSLILGGLFLEKEKEQQPGRHDPFSPPRACRLLPLSTRSTYQLIRKVRDLNEAVNLHLWLQTLILQLSSLSPFFH
jgi:hypothetical protein